MKKIIIFTILTAFASNSLILPSSYGQEAFLPEPGRMVMLSVPYTPSIIKGMKLYPNDPFKFDFIIDQGDSLLGQAQLKEESRSLIGYFLASLTTPEKEIWVNLSPYERERIAPAVFGQTQMGQELLKQDYLLKQIMASALYPEKELGKKFWAKVYTQAQHKFGTTNIPINTFNKVWIVPDKAVVYENARMNAVFVVESSLKVMLNQDYLAAQNNNTGDTSAANASSQMIKDIIIPALEKDVNEGKNFARLRQVYQSLILAKWYKDHLQQSVLGKGYVDHDKTGGITGIDRNLKEKIYDQYLKAYRRGVYNFIKEDVDPLTAKIVPRKYFSGGVTMLNVRVTNASKAQISTFRKTIIHVGLFIVGVSLFGTTAIAQTRTSKRTPPKPTLVSKNSSHKKQTKYGLSKKAKEELRSHFVIPEGIERDTPRAISDDPTEVETIPVEAGLQPFPIGNSFYADFGQSRRMNRTRLFPIHLGEDVPEPIGTPIFNPFKVEMLVENLIDPLAGKYVRLSLDIGPDTRLVFKFEHLSMFNPSINGIKVPFGAYLGKTGISGNAKGGPEPAHVHVGAQIEIDEYENNKIKTMKYVLDPYSYLENLHAQTTPATVLNNSLGEGYTRYALLQKYFPDANNFISFTHALMNAQSLGGKPKLGGKVKSKTGPKPDFGDIPGTSHIDKQIWNDMVIRMKADGSLSPDEDWTIPTLQRNALIEATYIETILENIEKTTEETKDNTTILKRLAARFLGVSDTNDKVRAAVEEYRRNFVADYLGVDPNHPRVAEIMKLSGPEYAKYRVPVSKSPAMTTIAPTGGIDLRKTSVHIQPGSGQIVTAFDGSGQLEMLIKATGIIPVIESVTPASAVMMNELLSSIN